MKFKPTSDVIPAPTKKAIMITELFFIPMYFDAVSLNPTALNLSPNFVL